MNDDQRKTLKTTALVLHAAIKMINGTAKVMAADQDTREALVRACDVMRQLQAFIELYEHHEGALFSYVPPN